MLGIEQEIVEQGAAAHRERAAPAASCTRRCACIRDEIEEAGESADEDIAEYARARSPRPSSRRRRASSSTRELRKLKQAPPMSPEVAVIRGFLDTVLELPWGRAGAGGGRRGRAWPGTWSARTTASRTSRTASSSTWPCAGCARTRRAGRPRGAAAGRRPAGHHPLSGRPARHRQEQRRAEHRRRAGAALRARRPRRRARRGRDPRASPHLHRGDAGAHHRGPRQGRRRQPGHAARRARQARQRLARQPGGGAHGGARPGAQPRASATTTSRCEYDLSRVFFIATANDIDGDPGTRSTTASR